MPATIPTNPAVETSVEYHVEAQDLGGRWKTWWVQGEGLENPTKSAETAQKVRAELAEMMAAGRSGWKAGRIMRVTTTRELVEHQNGQPNT